VQEKSQDQLDLQACRRVRSRLVSRRTATINQIRAFLIEQGIAVRAGPRALCKSLFAILDNRKNEISRLAKLSLGLYEGSFRRLRRLIVSQSPPIGRSFLDTPDQVTSQPAIPVDTQTFGRWTDHFRLGVFT